VVESVWPFLFRLFFFDLPLLERSAVPVFPDWLPLIPVFDPLPEVPFWPVVDPFWVDVDPFWPVDPVFPVWPLLVVPFWPAVPLCPLLFVEPWDCAHTGSVVATANAKVSALSLIAFTFEGRP